MLGLTTTTLLSDEMPPPMPSSWRPCGVRAAEGGEEERVPTRPLGRQVAAVEEEALAGAAPQEDGGERDLAHRDAASYGRFLRAAASSPAIRPKTAPRITEVEPV